MKNSVIYLSRNALLSNAKLLKNLAGNSLVCFNLKSNAYGHGAIAVAKILESTQPDYFSVHSIEEAILLRENNIKSKIYILGYVDPKDSELVIKNKLESVVYSKDYLKALINAASKFKTSASIHLKIETGLNRQGIKPDEVAQYVPFFKSKQINLKFLTTHFIDNKDDTDLRLANKQYKILKNVYDSLEPDFNDLKMHIGNSASLLNQSDYHLDMSRPGIALYGYWPSEMTRNRYLNLHKTDPLIPISKWETKIAQIKKVNKGDKVSYSGTYKFKESGYLAVLPVGYYEGINRNYIQDKSGVIIKNEFCPFVGRICMNNSMVKIDKKLYTELENLETATIIDNNYSSKISVEKVAEATNRTPYQIFTDIKEGPVQRITV